MLKTTDENTRYNPTNSPQVISLWASSSLRYIILVVMDNGLVQYDKVW